ncbi:PREDICTED: uncharacterized protein LOC109356135 [Lupinus angustifolius]|uniref:uncharacterized protein LOC109356135 n=1 Tax=Lupinus angustifolius TaxID=3871 RepID=UPI00092E755C|nr:PREDICTED: uncharacterized protein LOC109356135 [Lupinus angustifolius]
MATTCRLSKTESKLFDNPTLYRSIVGDLQYTTITRPDLAYSVNKVFQFMALCDADWATDLDEIKYASRACLFVGPNIVTWWSKKQQTISRSSTEAEYRSLTLVAQEMIWVESLLSELKISHQVPLILCDNLSTVSMSHNPVLQSMTKHI